MLTIDKQKINALIAATRSEDAGTANSRRREECQCDQCQITRGLIGTEVETIIIKNITAALRADVMQSAQDMVLGRPFRTADECARAYLFDALCIGFELAKRYYESAELENLLNKPET